MTRCPRCGSGIYFETAQRIKQDDGSFMIEIYRTCDACEFHEQETASDSESSITLK